MNLRSVTALLAAVALSACGSNAIQDITAAPPGAAIKFFNFGVNAPGVNFYAGTTKITAISSTTGAESTTGTIYGGLGNGGFYSGIAPGQYTFTANISATTDNNVAISSVPFTLADGKYYSMYISGFYDATSKKAEAFVVEDPFSTLIDYTVAYVRFVNGISNSSPMTLYGKNTVTGVELPIGGSISYRGAGTFTAVPSGVYDLNTRVAGSSTNAVSATAVSFSAGRVYSISSRGDMTIVSTSATNRPLLVNTLNR